MTKFKPIRKSERLYLDSGLVSNGHWMFSLAWALSLKGRLSLGLRRRVLKEQVARITARVNGTAGETRSRCGDRFQSFAASLPQYRVSPLSETKVIEGNIRGGELGPVALKVGPCHVDIEYAAAFLFDPGTELRTKGAADPVLILKDGAIVGAVMPLNPEVFKNKGRA